MAVLDKIIKGKQPRPFRILLHGEGGVGKSTFFSEAPDPLFVDPERRTGHLDVARCVPDTWTEVLQVMGEAFKAKTYRTLVFSTIDYIEQMVWAELCKKEGASSIDGLGGGWGKGYGMARDEFNKFLNYAERLVDGGINIAIESHSDVETFKNPQGDDFDRWFIKLHKKTRGLFTAKMDAIGFATFEDFAKKKDKTDKVAKAITTGERIVHWGHHPACQSKAGFNLPDQMPLKWSEFAKYLNPT